MQPRVYESSCTVLSVEHEPQGTYQRDGRLLGIVPYSVHGIRREGWLLTINIDGYGQHRLKSIGAPPVNLTPGDRTGIKFYLSFSRAGGIYGAVFDRHPRMLLMVDKSPLQKQPYTWKWYRKVAPRPTLSMLVASLFVIALPWMVPMVHPNREIIDRVRAGQLSVEEYLVQHEGSSPSEAAELAPKVRKLIFNEERAEESEAP